MKSILAGLALLGCTLNSIAAPPPKVDQSALREAMADALKDADSAKFKDIRLKQKEGLWLICGSVNARNSFGGYAGFSPFFVVGILGQGGTSIRMFVAPAIGDVAALHCAQEHVAD